MNAKEYFDKAAETWDEKFLTSRLSSFLATLVPQFNLKSGQTVLDVGTGTGVLVPYLAEAVGPEGSVTAIDLSEKMAQKCKEKYSHLKNVTVNVGNIENEPFPQESFDAVVCFGVFPHIDNKQKVLQNINRILTPNGKLVIAHALSSEELKEHHKKVSARMAHALLPSMPEMTKLLEQNGFTQITIKDEPGCYLCTATKSRSF
jgi:ubiquinone/menaquinone biosynthesis C-methylase UbiE